MSLTALNHFDHHFHKPGYPLDNWLSDRWFVARPNQRSLSLDMRETDTGYEVKVDLTGVERENMNVSVKNGTLSISTERVNVKEEESYCFSERIYGSVSTFSSSEGSQHELRSIHLPEDANDQDIKAKCENGVLVISLTKDENLGRRTIAIE
jgi:HSP20 family protein